MNRLFIISIIFSWGDWNIYKIRGNISFSRKICLKGAYKMLKTLIIG